MSATCRKYHLHYILKRGVFFCIEGIVSRDVEAVLMDGPHPLTKVEACRRASACPTLEAERLADRALFEADALSDEETPLNDMVDSSRVALRFGQAPASRVGN